MRANQPTMDDFYNMYKNEEVTISTTQYQECIECSRYPNRIILINGITIFDRYFSEIDATAGYKEFSIEEQEKYFYRPKKFSYDTYGTTEMWSIILRLNEMDSISDFNSPKIRVPSTRIVEKLVEIMDLEKSRIDENQEEIIRTLKEYQ